MNKDTNQETVLITLNDDNDNTIAQVRMTEEELENLEAYADLAEIDFEEYLTNLIMNEVESNSQG